MAGSSLLKVLEATSTDCPFSSNKAPSAAILGKEILACADTPARRFVKSTIGPSDALLFAPNSFKLDPILLIASPTPYFSSKSKLPAIFPSVKPISSADPSRLSPKAINALSVFVTKSSKSFPFKFKRPPAAANPNKSLIAVLVSIFLSATVRAVTWVRVCPVVFITSACASFKATLAAVIFLKKRKTLAIPTPIPNTAKKLPAPFVNFFNRLSVPFISWFILLYLSCNAFKSLDVAAKALVPGLSLRNSFFTLRIRL